MMKQLGVLLLLLLIPSLLLGEKPNPLLTKTGKWDLVHYAHSDPDGFRESSRRMMDQHFKMMNKLLWGSGKKTAKKVKAKPIRSFQYLLKQLITSYGSKRNDIIMELYRDYPMGQTTKTMIQWIKSGSDQQRIAAVYTASILKSPRYERYFKKLFKIKNLDPALKRELMIAVGTNGFKRLNRYICGFLSNKYDQKIALAAIRNIGTPICKRAIKKQLVIGSKETKKSILTLLIRGKYQMKKTVRNIFKKEHGKLKKKAAMALIAMGDKRGGNYLKKIFLKNKTDQYQQYRNYRQIHKNFRYSNEIAKKLLLAGFQHSSFTSVKLYCGVSLLFRGVNTALKTEIESILKEHQNSQNMQIITILARYETYLKYQKKRR